VTPNGVYGLSFWQPSQPSARKGSASANAAQILAGERKGDLER
jgi:hypothetical protein